MSRHHIEYAEQIGSKQAREVNEVIIQPLDNTDEDDDPEEDKQIPGQVSLEDAI